MSFQFFYRFNVTELTELHIAGFFTSTPVRTYSNNERFPHDNVRYVSACRSARMRRPNQNHRQAEAYRTLPTFHINKRRNIPLALFTFSLQFFAVPYSLVCLDFGTLHPSLLRRINPSGSLAVRNADLVRVWRHSYEITKHSEGDLE